MRKIIIDSSPLIIHLVGVFDIKLVGKVSLYNLPEDEFKCIDRLLSIYDSIFITPYVLGELFWLAKSRLKKKGDEVKRLFLRYKEALIKFDEIFVKKDEILNFKNLEFGLTDVSLFLIAKKINCPILTSDKRFAAFCRGNNLNVIDFVEPLFNPHLVRYAD